MTDPSTPSARGGAGGSGQVLPSGTVTFLFTDIEGSTSQAQRNPMTWEATRARHHDLIQQAIIGHRGRVFQVIGDAFCVAFPTATDALTAAQDAQRALQAEVWGKTPIRVRMGLHTGAAEARDGEYFGYLTLAQAQRVMAAAYGGQTLISDATEVLLRGQLPEGTTLLDLGEQQLKGLPNREHLWQVVVPDLPQDFPPLQSVVAIPNNLPIQVTSFVGREKETAEVKRLLATTRLLTLTGTGGTGKTRLSLQVAAEVLDGFPDGAWFVELAPLSDPALLPLTIASVLGVREEQSRALLATLLEWLRPKELLLILDNCEHLIDACAKFADAAIHASRETRILASSREALAIAGEQAYPVPSLSQPNALPAMTAEDLRPYESVRLFVERATAVQPHFALNDDNAAAIAQICYRLDGIPLAIELAAARVRTLNVEQIAKRLDDRFRLLTGGNRTALPRQQTLRSLVDWSYSLLSEPERVLLRRLSVFADGWTLAAAEAVCAGVGQDGILPHVGQEAILSYDVLDLLTRLVDKSLVVAVPGTADIRYHLLETMRQYAREKLLDAGESERLRDQHLAFFLKLSEHAEPNLSGAAQTTWFDRLEKDYANLRAAHEWSLQDSDALQSMRLATALVMLWNVRGPAVEGADWLVRAVSRPEAAAPSLVRAKALQATARVLGNLGEQVRSIPFVEESLAISRALEYQPGVTRALLHLAVNARLQGDLKTSVSLLEQSLAIGEGLDSGDLGFIYADLGWNAAVESDYDTALKYFQRAMTVARAAENSHLVAMAFYHLGILAFLNHDYDGAEATLEQSLNAGRAIGYKAVVSMSARGLAYVALQWGQLVPFQLLE